MGLLGLFDCRKCRESHVRTVLGYVSFYNTDKKSNARLRDLKEMIERYRDSHPELEVFYGGDERSIIGRHKGTLDRFGASS